MNDEITKPSDVPSERKMLTDKINTLYENAAYRFERFTPEVETLEGVADVRSFYVPFIESFCQMHNPFQPNYEVVITHYGANGIHLGQVLIVIRGIFFIVVGKLHYKPDSLMMVAASTSLSRLPIFRQYTEGVLNQPSSEVYSALHDFIDADFPIWSMVFMVQMCESELDDEETELVATIRSKGVGISEQQETRFNNTFAKANETLFNMADITES